MRTMCRPWPAPLLAGAESKATAAEPHVALHGSAWGSRSGLSSQCFAAAAWRKTRQSRGEIQRDSLRHAEGHGRVAVSDADGAGWSAAGSRMIMPYLQDNGNRHPARLLQLLDLLTQWQAMLERETHQPRVSPPNSASFHAGGINAGVKRAVQGQWRRVGPERSSRQDLV